MALLRTSSLVYPFRVSVSFLPFSLKTVNLSCKSKVKVIPCTSTEALYRPYGP
jgi:hypothetical protein